MSETTKAGPRGRRTVARHGELKSPSALGQVLKVVAVCMAVLLVSGVGVGVYLFNNLATSFTADAVELEGQDAVPPDIGEIEGGVNLFLAGTDACEPEYAYLFGDRCTGPDAEGELNDVNMLVHISDTPRRVTVVSFPRDLMIPMPECVDEEGNTSGPSSREMLNSAFTSGGLNCATQTIAQLSGQNIQFAASVTWGGVIEITNAIGGVDVCLSEAIKDRDSGLDLPAGTSTIEGVQALQFLRARHAIGDGGDLSRISNQQQYMSSLARKLVSEEVLTNPGTLYKLASTTLEAVTPSQTLTNPLTLVQIALAVKGVPFEEIVFVQYPVYDDPNDANRVIPNEDAADRLWAALEANQPITLTGTAGAGVEVTNPDGTPIETAPPVEPVEPTDPSAAPTPAPTSDAVALPSDITGTNAAQSTCTRAN